MLQLAVAFHLPHQMDPWENSPAQRRGQWCPSSVAQGWLHHSRYQPVQLMAAGPQTLLSSCAEVDVTKIPCTVGFHVRVLCDGDGKRCVCQPCT